MSWVTTTEAETYFANRPYSASWNAATSAMKNQYLTWAETVLANSFSWSTFSGVECTNTGTSIVCDKVKKALFEEAIYLLELGDSINSSSILDRINSISVGGISAEFAVESAKGENSSNPLLAPNAILFIGDLGVLNTCISANGCIQSTMLEI